MAEKVIIFDTETTSLMQPSLATSAQQPYIIEFAAIRFDVRQLDMGLIDFKNDLRCDKLEFFAQPPIPISAETKKVTGLTDEILKEKYALPFVAYLTEIQEFFLGERIFIAHNLGFDRAVLAEELKRVDALLRFPWPPIHFCTTENTQDLLLKDRKLKTLYEHYMGKPLQQSHRAMDDVLALADIVVKMREEGRLPE